MLIIEGCCSDTLAYVSNLTDLEEALQYVADKRNAAPTIKWAVECYHYEYVTKTVQG